MSYPIPEESKLRDVQEIQEAHDILVQLNEHFLSAGNYSTHPLKKWSREFAVMADVLCWALNHKDNAVFADKLKNIKENFIHEPQ